MNSLEARLRSLQPRRPSAGLKRRLFSAPGGLMPPASWFLSWLVPATACALFVSSALTSGSGIAKGPRREPMLAMVLSNQNYAVYAATAGGQRENAPRPDTFQWTNLSSSTSTMRLMPFMKSTD